MKQVQISPLSLRLRPSITSLLIIITPHGMAVALVQLIGFLPVYIRLVTLILIGISFVYTARLHLWKNLTHAVLEIQQDSTGNWYILDGRNRQKPVELQSSSFVNIYASILNFKDQHKRSYTALITPGSLSESAFRQLRVRIRTRRNNAAQAARNK